ncbi:MAG: recombinase family protein [Oscillospiraceae bacterium]|jgi:site-specific DNA recombinase|nr:recombinase family protein [Oscillospiraceae bacterium]
MSANAVIYARFSSDRQREESIEGQLRECREYANKNGIRVIDSYIDRALSASKDTDKRLDFQRMIRDSGKHLFDTVLVWKLDRFARNRYDSAHYKNLLKKNGVRVVSATEHITEGPEGIILESMLEGMAEYYSAELSEKIHRGQKDNALKGRNNGGRIPLGFKLGDDKRLEIDPATALIVQEIFKRYAEGETVRAIVDDLNNRGLKTSRGYKFAYPSFNTLLQNRKYMGEFKYQDVVIPGGVPALVDEDTFNRVQARMAKNKQAPATAKAKENYLLTTKLFCGECGKIMFGESGTGTGGKVYRYYKCASAKKKTGCHKKAVKKEWIETLVVEQTMALVMNGPLMEQITDRLLAMQGQESFDLRLLKKQLKEAEKGIENMLNAIQMGIITPSTKQRLAELEEQKTRLEQQMILEQIKNPALSREQITFFLDQYKKTDTTDEAQRQRLIDCFVNAVFVYDDKIVLTFNYKDGTKTISLDDVNSSDMVGNGPPQIRLKPLVSGGFFCFASLFCGLDFSRFGPDHINDHRQKKSAPGWGQRNAADLTGHSTDYSTDDPRFPVEAMGPGALAGRHSFYKPPRK